MIAMLSSSKSEVAKGLEKIADVPGLLGGPGGRDDVVDGHVGLLSLLLVLLVGGHNHLNDIAFDSDAASRGG